MWQNNGAVALLRQEKDYPPFLAYHCLIHQEALCAKQVGFGEVMAVVVSIICFIRARALNHRQFKLLLEEHESPAGDVFLHTEVRWVSRATVLVRFCQLLSEIRVFLSSKNSVHDELSDPAWLLKLAFLTDISVHLNTLNVQLQGENRTLPALYQSIESFQRKLSLFGAHISTNNFTHFSTLAKMVEDVDVRHVLCRELEFGSAIDLLSQDFEARFSECRAGKSLFQFVTAPFSFEPDALIDFVPTNDIAAAQLALLELQSDTYLTVSSEVNRTDPLLMWKSISSFQPYRVLCSIAKKVLSMFGSTYRCEAAFSAMKGIKSKDRNRITDGNLKHCVRAATTKYAPSYKHLVQNMQCHESE